MDVIPPSPPAARLSPLLAVMLAVLGLMTLLALLWPVRRTFLDIAITHNEGWNAYFADAAWGAMPLYPARDRLIVNNYPPLSFYVVGGLGRLLGDTILAGRLLSLAALVVLAAGAALATRRLGGGHTGALVSALFFAATMGRFFTNYVGQNDPHLLAQAVMTLGFVAFLRALDRDRGYPGPVLLMALAGFFKHNLAVLPVTAMLWLAWQRPRRLLVCLPLAVLAIAGGLALCTAVYGPDFLANLTCPRAFNWKRVFSSVGHLQWVAVALAASVYLAFVRPRDPGVQVCGLMTVLGLAAFLLQKAGDGVAHNAQFELVFATAVGLGLAWTHAPSLPLTRRFASADSLRVLMLVAVCLRLAASTRLEFVRQFVDAAFRAEIAARQEAVNDTVARIRAVPGDVLSWTYPCYRSGKPFAVDPFTLEQRIKTGHLPADVVPRLVAAGRLSVVEANPCLEWEKALPSPPPTATAAVPHASHTP